MTDEEKRFLWLSTLAASFASECINNRYRHQGNDSDQYAQNFKCAKWDADAILKQVDIHERDQLQRELKE